MDKEIGCVTLLGLTALQFVSLSYTFLTQANEFAAHASIFTYQWTFY